MNPYLILAALIAVGSMTGYSYYLGGKHKANAIAAEQKRQDELVAKVQQSTADAIAQIRVTNRTIRQEVQREIVEKPVFRDCRSGDASLQLYNTAAGYQPDAAPGGQLHEAGQVGG